MMQISAISFSACIDANESKLMGLKDSLKEEYDVKYNSELELLTIRHFNNNKNIIDQLTSGRKILMEQLSRNTAQFVLKDL